MDTKSLNSKEVEVSSSIIKEDNDETKTNQIKSFSYQNEYDDSCYMSTLINVFTLAENINNNDDTLTLIHTLQAYSIQIIEKYLNLLIGFYVLFNESNKVISTVILDFLQIKARNSLKFSHLILFNILSCKNNYKKHIEYEAMTKLMISLMNDWNMPLDYNIERSYHSLFNSASNYEEFCKKNLVKLKAPSEYIKGDELKLKSKKKSKKANGKVDINKWEVYISEIAFINDIVLLSEVMKYIRSAKRHQCLMKFIKRVNNEFNPIYFNYLFDDYVISHFITDYSVYYLKNINMEYSFCLSTKEHVPYHLLLELTKNGGYALYSNNNCDNNNKPNGHSDTQTELNKALINNPLSKSSDISSTNSNNQGFSRFFSVSYYLNNLSFVFQCIKPPMINEFDNSNETQYESTNEEKHPITTLSPDSIGLFGKKTYTQIKKELTSHDNIQLLPIIIKGGEDLRQDYFVSQATSLFLSIFQKENLEIFLQPLQILPTGKGGIMKTLPDTTSLMKINKVNYSQFEGFSSSTYYIDPEIDKDNITKSALRNYFLMKYGNTDEFTKALYCFIQSLTGYSLLCYFLEIKDRNNGNILINDKGYMIHIDFGFLLGKSPGNVNLEQAPFKLTWDFVELMMGVKSKYFDTFRQLMVKGLLALRKEYKTICGFVKIFMDTNADLLCFNDREGILSRLQDKFFLSVFEEKEIEEKVNMLILTSLDNWRTLVYDQFQKFCVGIN